MKRFSKLILSVAAVSAVSAAMVISASAMEASYADGVVTLTGVGTTGTSQTLLVLDTVDLQTVAAENITQIDQKDDGTSFETVTVGALDDGTYEVRIGGNGEIQTATFTVGTPSPGGETETITIGDVDPVPGVGSSDASAILAKVASKSTPMNAKVGTTRTDIDGNTITIGDVDPVPGVGSSDASAILAKVASKSTPMNAKVGTTVEVVVD